MLRGVGRQTFASGSVADPADLAIFGNTELRLTDEAAFEIYNVRLSLRGGSLVLDNSGVIRPNRLQHEELNNNAIIRGHGRLELVGNADAEVTEAVGTLQLTSAGTVEIAVDHRGGTGTSPHAGQHHAVRWRQRKFRWRRRNAGLGLRSQNIRQPIYRSNKWPARPAT